MRLIYTISHISGIIFRNYFVGKELNDGYNKHYIICPLLLTKRITFYLLHNFSQPQKGRQRNSSLAHLHDLHLLFLQLHVCITSSIVLPDSSPTFHKGMKKNTFIIFPFAENLSHWPQLILTENDDTKCLWTPFPFLNSDCFNSQS